MELQDTSGSKMQIGGNRVVLEVSSIEVERIDREIHVWSAALDREPSDLRRLEAKLSQDEKARSNRFHFERDKNHYIVARGLLRELLGGYLRRDPAELKFSYGAQGKPFLASANGSTELCFNLSHSAGLAVYAIAPERNLGIDAELVRPDYAKEDIARRFFSAREVDELLSLPAEKRDEGFFHCWTRKEAYIKARGMGLAIPLDSFTVSLSPERPAEFLGGVEPCWHLVSYYPAEGYAGALVYDGAACSIEYFSVDSDLE
jgi:4'-phosphopantetheinyl transferase